MVVQKIMFGWMNMTLHTTIRQRMKNLLGLFVAAVAFLTAIYHLTNLYFAKQVAFEHFILVDGGAFPLLFWGGYVLVGTLLPLALIYLPALSARRGSVLAASLLVILGAFCHLYVFIIGGQSFPLDIFPGMEVSSSFFDGEIEHYTPSLPELLLGLGGIGIAFTATTIGVRILQFVPEDDMAQLEAANNLLD
jgi:molybdopterin-containing oxidoreductase family membrane subunit